MCTSVLRIEKHAKAVPSRQWNDRASRVTHLMTDKESRMIKLASVHVTLFLVKQMHLFNNACQCNWTICEKWFQGWHVIFCCIVFAFNLIPPFCNSNLMIAHKKLHTPMILSWYFKKLQFLILQFLKIWPWENSNVQSTLLKQVSWKNNFFV